MNVPTKLGLFGAALVVAFGVGAGAGRLVGPVDRPAPAHTGQPPEIPGHTAPPGPHDQPSTQDQPDAHNQPGSHGQPAAAGQAGAAGAAGAPEEEAHR
ncbi:hypothetical protein [Pilimelia columellifera]|uniref:Uncharacterized protein n=1 Tax=Pilimelia columellifera subsp. columellifera TaxID=706583 RepID=A0ABP6AAB5_9ACTN